MAELVVRAERLGKRYRLGALATAPPQTLRETLSQLPGRAWHAVTRSGGRGERPGKTDLWAVRDLTLELPRGEILGIAGANGSGKSTVLRLASGITEPTEGWIATRGRVATLLEVGTGFHPDLTGRENILLSGIVLGMRAAAVRRRFNEIVEFAGVSRFVETPVKHYSSGMYLRLAFAVAAHLEADVLLIDEGLSVGDLGFQEKCLSRIAAVREEGRTVLFVTHNMSALRRLCTRALLMDGGRPILAGTAEDVARGYEERSVNARRTARPIVRLPVRLTDTAGRGLALRFFDHQGAPKAAFASGAPWRARLEFEVDHVTKDVLAALTLGRFDGTTLLTLLSARRSLDRGRHRVEFVCDLRLAPADLVVGVELWSGDEALYREEDAALVEIAEAPGRVPHPVRRGFVLGPRLAEIVPESQTGE